MSNNNDRAMSDDDKALVDRVQAVQTQLKSEKISDLLKDTANPKLPLAQRESLANRAMWLLKDAQKGANNRVDYNIPNPNFVRFQAVQPISLPADALTKDAYSSNDTSTLFLRLEMIAQVAIAAMQGPPLAADGTPAVLTDDQKAAMAQVNALRADVRETHYAIVAVGLHLHYYLDWLFTQWGGAKFLDAKTQVEGLLMAYNSHAPDFAVILEENALRGVRVATGITHDVWNYLTSPAFYQLQQAKQAQEAELAQPVAAAPPAVATAPPFLFPSAVASPAAAPAAPSTAAAPAAAAALAKVMRVEKKKKGSGFASVFAVTAAESVTIDLTPTRNPTDVISEIEQLFLTYISEGLDTITQMKAAAQPIDFNIYTNQFGSTASMTDNVSMLEGIRANIVRYISDQFHPSPAYEPLLFVVMDMVTKFFPGPIGPGDPVSTLNLLPGESVEKRMKTSETDTTKRAQTNSVVDSNSQTAKQNLKNTIQNTQNQSHDVTSDTNKYTSAKETTTSHNTNNTTGLGAAGTGMGGQAQGAAGGVGGVMQSVGGIMSMIPGVGGILGGIVNVVGGLIGGAGSSGGSGGSSSGVGGEIGSAVGGVMNTLQNVGVIKGGPKSNLTDIASKDATTEKNETDKLTDVTKSSTQAMQEAVSENSQDTNQSRQVSVTDSTETTSETTKEDTETRTFKNPNRSSALTIVFSNVLRRYTSVTMVEGIHVMFGNGIVADSMPVDQINTILDTIIRADRQDVKDMAVQYVKVALRVTDWQDRVINLLDQTVSYPRLKIQPYFDMLGQAGLSTEAGDSLIQPFHADLMGVVTGVTDYSMVVPGVFCDVDVGHVAYDDVEMKLVNLEIARKEKGNKQLDLNNDRLSIENVILQNKGKFVDELSDPEQKLKAYFQIFKDDKVVLDKAFLGNFLNELSKDGSGWPRMNI